MAINFTDFTNARRAQDNFSGVSDLLPNILAGYKAAKAPEEHQTEQAYKRALTLKALREAQEGSTLTGHARVAKDLQKLMEDPNATPETKALAKQLFDMEKRRSEATIENIGSMIEQRDFSSLPEAYKQQLLGQYQYYGYGPLEAKALYKRGIYPAHLAQGGSAPMGGGGQQQQNATPGGETLPPEDVDFFAQVLNKPQGAQQAAVAPQQQNVPVAPQQQIPAPNQIPGVPQTSAPLPLTTAMTSGDISTVNQLKGSSAEEAYIAPKIAKALGRYPRKLFGKSPVQIWDSLNPSEKDEDNLAEFYAAQALQSGVAGNRARLENSSTAAGALNDIKHTSLNMIGSYDWQVSPAIYKKAQELISEWIQGMTAARIKGISGQNEEFSNTIKKSQSKAQQPKINLDSDDPFGVL